jgi:hypothetical protein
VKGAQVRLRVSNVSVESNHDVAYLVMSGADRIDQRLSLRHEITPSPFDGEKLIGCVFVKNARHQRPSTAIDCMAVTMNAIHDLEARGDLF